MLTVKLTSPGQLTAHRGGRPRRQPAHSPRVMLGEARYNPAVVSATPQAREIFEGTVKLRRSGRDESYRESRRAS